MKHFNKYITLLEAKQEIIAVVPGSFKPPTIGHYEMIEAYSKRADKVIVLVSAPTKAKRLTSLGTEVTQEQAVKVLKIYTSKLKNVEIIASPTPSPVKATYDYVETLDDVTVLLGASKKGGDYKRWKSAPAYFEKKQINVNVVEAEEAAVNVKTMISASDIRDDFTAEKVKSSMPKISPKDSDAVLKILGL